MTIREINLVPVEILQGNLMKRLILRWSLALTLCLMIIFGNFWYQTRIVLARLRPSTTLAEMHAQLGATLDEINAAQKETERLSTQQAILKQLSVHQSFPELLELLADTLNPQTWLAKMEIEAGGPKEIQPSMRLKGYSVSNELLAEFLTHLSAAKPVNRVVLKLAQEARLPGMIPDSDQLVQVVDFDLACGLERLKP